MKKDKAIITNLYNKKFPLPIKKCIFFTVKPNKIAYNEFFFNNNLKIYVRKL